MAASVLRRAAVDRRLFAIAAVIASLALAVGAGALVVMAINDDDSGESVPCAPLGHDNPFTPEDEDGDC